MLPARFQEPAGFTTGHFKNTAGADIRYGSLQPQGEPKGTIIMAQGFQETTEMYFETMRDLTARGFAVWMLDWHGQGGSERFLKSHPQKMHNNGYDEHIATLDQFTKEIVKKSKGPLILMGHSMGGHITLRYLKEHPGVFDAAMVSSPMVDIQTPGFPKLAAKLLAKGADLFHALKCYIPGEQHNWDAKQEVIDTAEKLTSDPARAAIVPALYEAHPELKMGGTTFGWVLNTFKSIKILNDENYLKAIKTPLLMTIPGDERVVERSAELRASELIPNVTRVEIPGAKHDIWREADKYRNVWLANVDKFLAQVISLKNAPAAPKPKNGPKI